jgi:uracil-DNA glycosylase family 4
VSKLETLLTEIRGCRACEAHLEPNPVVQAGEHSRILVVGQAPGRKVHESGLPWNDASGDLLREWLGVDDTVFYDPAWFAQMPMGLCYPGKGRSGDLPPRKECAPLWHEALKAQMPQIQLTLLIGQYAQKHYLGAAYKGSLTETVRAYREFWPDIIPLPHPSPLNRHWLKKNPWFEREVLPDLRRRVASVLAT